MLFVPQLRRQGSLVCFTPSRTHAHRIGKHMVIVQSSASFVSSYIIDLSGQDAEQFHVRYLPSICGDSPDLDASGSTHACLYVSDTRKKCLDGHRLGMLVRNRLIVFDLALQVVDSFQLEGVLSILPGQGCLMAVSSSSFSVLSGRSFTTYYLTSASISTSKPVLSFGCRAEILSYSLCGDMPICIIKYGTTIKIFWGARAIKSFKASSRPGDRYTACNGRVFRIRRLTIDVYGVGSRLVLENTIQAREGAHFVGVFPTYNGHTAVEVCSEGVFSHYLYENGTRLPTSCEVVADLPLFSVLEKNGKILLNVCEREDIENPEDLDEAGNYLLLANPTDDRLFHRTIMFVLFKRFMKIEHALTGSKLCGELSQFTSRILCVFDCASLIDCDIQRHFRRLVSERTLIDCLVLDFRPVDYPFAQYKDVYSILAAINADANITVPRNVDIPSDMMNSILEAAMKMGKHDIFLDLIDICSTAHASFLMGIPAGCYRDKERLARMLIEFAVTGSCAGRVVDYLHGLYHLIPLQLLRDSRELQYRVYRRLLEKLSQSPDSANLDSRPVDLMLGVGRRDLGCILGYTLYVHSKGMLQNETREKILDMVRKNIDDYVFVFDGRFIGHETL